VSLEIFRNDDDSYERWLAEHPHGSVLNDSKTLTLHTAGCDHVDITRGRAGVRWTVTAGKICAGEAAKLIGWAEEERRRSPVRLQSVATRRDAIERLVSNAVVWAIFTS
jgi:hypothetical protein